MKYWDSDATFSGQNFENGLSPLREASKRPVLNLENRWLQLLAITDLLSFQRVTFHSMFFRNQHGWLKCRIFPDCASKEGDNGIPSHWTTQR